MVYSHSRPTRSDMWPSAICPGMPARLTRPSARAARIGLESDFGQVLGLVDLYRAPRAGRADVAEHGPPVPRRPHWPCQRPVHGRPVCIHHMATRRSAACPGASPSGLTPTSSGRRCSSRCIGASSAINTTPRTAHPAHQPADGMKACSHGRMTIEPTPTPENASPIARPRRRTTQLGRNNP